MDWKDVLHFGIESLATYVGIFIASKAAKITDSIEKLNLSVSVLLERSSNQEKRIDRLENPNGIQ